MKKESGITLIKICLIVAIIFIVATICAFIFKESNEKKNLNKFISQMVLIQEKVNFIRSEYKIWDKYNPNESGNFYTYLQELGYSNANNPLTNPYIEEFNKIIKEIDENEVNNWDSRVDTIITNYCYFSPEDLKKYLDLEQIEQHVIINFYTGNIISKNGVKEEEKTIYRQYDSSIGNQLITPSIYNSESLPKLEIVENYGLSQRVKITLDKKDNANIMEVYYFSSLTDESKKKCSNLNGYENNQKENYVCFNIENSGDYTFIVEDTNFVQYPKIEWQFNLCNPPEMLDGMMGIYWEENGNETRIISEHDSKWYNYSKKDFRMANAKTEDGNYWVWIPRFLYKETIESTDIEFVKEKTDIATNNRVMQGYEISKAFSENGEISGFWIAKFQGNIEKEQIHFKPGKTLNIFTLPNIQNRYKNLLSSKIKPFADIMSENKFNANLLISNAIEVEISNNLVHYAGGSPNEEEFKTNTKYSSSNNVYGVYDLKTSENELTKNSKAYEEGRIRLVLINK